MSGASFLPDTEEDCECRVLVVGYSGSGKSSLANKLIGKTDVESSSPDGNLAEEDQPSAGFMVSKGFDSATRKSQFQTARLCRNGRMIRMRVVDTPGLLGFGEEDSRKTKAEIRRGFSLCCPGGPHVVLFALPLGRFTEEQERSFDEILQLFGKKVERHLIVVFTHGENLKQKSIEEILAHTPVKGLKKVKEVVGTQYVVTSNIPDRRESEIDALIDQIFQVKDRCGWQPLTKKEPTEAKVDGAAALGFGFLALTIIGVAVIALKYYHTVKKH